ncbi:class I SAM-dependent methyltransferase [Pseudomonas entomophila]|uniref:class I SAM-dependent methyltransferase n=1 Tax=Pseudomonas entomophila TaxID=312306 RepID=UPI0023D7F9ED|nr:class I SAM-dependent methyltransferase [Pseudomonas entomophila]MDF0729305.1 class I SAM-dependent methyltransferase [Pseudomonas entomophila]
MPSLTPANPLAHDLQHSAMLKLAAHFHSLATGASQVPSQSVASHLREQLRDPRLLDYHDRLIAGAGPLFTHFLASVPYILEELCRVGVALAELARQAPGACRLLEVDAFDGSHGRALAGHSEGRVHSLTTSPNPANQAPFERHADPQLSRFYPHSFLTLEPEPGAAGFDFIYEMAAFQFYSQARQQHVAHLKRFLKPGGLALFLEKLNHDDPQEYLRRERVKDEGFKTRYFSAQEIAWKRQQMLEQMHNGQVTRAALLEALHGQFRHVRLLWNSSNFYEFVASDDRERLDAFVAALGPVVQPDGFCFEAPEQLGGAHAHA